MALNDILRNMNLFVDGRGYAGNVEELTPPKLTLKTEEVRNGGMDAPVEVEVGMEKMEASFSLTKYDADVLAQFGMVAGNLRQLTFRASMGGEDGLQTPVVINLTGVLKEYDPGSWKPGEKAVLKFSMAVRYYKHTVNDKVLHEIDVPNMLRIVNGVDQLAQVRKNLGM